MKSERVSPSVVSDSLQPCGLEPARLLCPGGSPGKNAGVACHFLLRGIFPAQESHLGLLCYRQILYCLRQQGRPLLPKPSHLPCRREERVPSGPIPSSPVIQIHHPSCFCGVPGSPLRKAGLPWTLPRRWPWVCTQFCALQISFL